MERKMASGFLVVKYWIPFMATGFEVMSTCAFWEELLTKGVSNIKLKGPGGIQLKTSIEIQKIRSFNLEFKNRES